MFDSAIVLPNGYYSKLYLVYFFSNAPMRSNEGCGGNRSNRLTEGIRRGIDVRCFSALVRHELTGDIPDAGPDFQHIMADVRSNLFGHPIIEPLGETHGT